MVRKMVDYQANMFSADDSFRNSEFDRIELSEEQSEFIRCALGGNNILVDACIGSGKTTAIQYLCQVMPKNRRILYLTYNRLLKLDAQKRIRNQNVTVTNYHGFASMALAKAKINSGIQDLIQNFLIFKPPFDFYDVLVIDEYQDIEEELAKMLEVIKSANPGMQLIAVGDMQQKIYDKTTLDIQKFIDAFLCDYTRLTFTKCFRLSADHAAMLGRVWKKKIDGVNKSCDVCEMSREEAIELISKYEPRDIICLGTRNGELISLLNELEEGFPEKYNKHTAYASIADYDNLERVKTTDDVAIFTTYDSSKGLERRICIVFDFTEEYWKIRADKPLQKYEILRNIFCVAASRGKEKIVFVKKSYEKKLSEKTLVSFFETVPDLRDVSMSSMFDFKYTEDVEKCYNCLNVKKIDNADNSIINVKATDNLIDLSPCVGVFQEAFYFDNYDVDKDIKLNTMLHEENRSLFKNEVKKASLEKRILFLTYIETRQERYWTQATENFITESAKKQLKDRLDTVFTSEDESQVGCSIDFADSKGTYRFSALGFADVVKNNTVYELKFVAELMHKHFLQCASYMIALGLSKGVLWNTRTNDMYEIGIKNKDDFMNALTIAITKRIYEKYKAPSFSNGKYKMQQFDYKLMEKLLNEPTDKTDNTTMINIDNSIKNNPLLEVMLSKEKIAVIDTETNNDGELLSVGVVFADKESFTPIGRKYYVVDPAYKKPSMFFMSIFNEKAGLFRKVKRQQLASEIVALLKENNAKSIFAYNAAFDYKLLDELHDYPWYDIMKLAAYKQYNDKIPAECEFCSTGRLRYDYGAEAIYKLLSGDEKFIELHNAILDASCELKIIEMLKYPFSAYENARYIKKQKK